MQHAGSSCLTRDQTRFPASEARSLNRWTTREVPPVILIGPKCYPNFFNHRFTTIDLQLFLGGDFLKEYFQNLQQFAMTPITMQVDITHIQQLVYGYKLICKSSILKFIPLYHLDKSNSVFVKLLIKRYICWFSYILNTREGFFLKDICYFQPRYTSQADLDKL